MNYTDEDSDTNSIPAKEPRGKLHEVDDASLLEDSTNGAVQLIKTRNSGSTDSTIRVKGSQEVLYSFRSTGMIGISIYRGHKLSDEAASYVMSADTLPATLVATVHFTSIDYFHSKLVDPIKIPESTYLYNKRWYKM